jgi:hypothetical protein
MDGGVYAYRADLDRGHVTPALRMAATTLDPVPVGDRDTARCWPSTTSISGAVLVGASDGRVFAICLRPTQASRPCLLVADTLLVGGSPAVSDVSSNPRGSFTGAGGFQVAYALRNGMIGSRIRRAGSQPVPRSVERGNRGFAPTLIGSTWTAPPTEISS